MTVCWMIYVTVIFCLISNVYFNCIVQDSLYHDMDIGTMCHCALVSCTPSQSIGVVLGYVLFWCWVSLGVHFTNSLIEFYFIMIVVIDLLFNKTLHSQVAVSDSNGIQNKITDGRDWTYIWFRADGSTLIWFCISFDLDTTCTIVAVRLLLSGCEGFLAS